MRRGQNHTSPDSGSPEQRLGKRNEGPEELTFGKGASFSEWGKGTGEEKAALHLSSLWNGVKRRMLRGRWGQAGQREPGEAPSGQRGKEARAGLGACLGGHFPPGSGGVPCLPRGSAPSRGEGRGQEVGCVNGRWGGGAQGCRPHPTTPWMMKLWGGPSGPQHHPSV